MQRLKPHSWLGIAALSLAVILASIPAAHAMKLKRQNLAQLISQSESILSGTVRSVTDGLNANGVPYTEVTIAVGATAKGKAKSGEDYTFRQYGLIAPRKLPNGKTLLAVTPEGFPRWSEGEYVVAFRYKPASLTGLQTTSGMEQGKLTSVNGQLANSFDNAGLFEDLTVDSSLVSPEESAMLQSHGAVDTQLFMHLVGRAVSENWIENGGMQ